VVFLKTAEADRKNLGESPKKQKAHNEMRLMFLLVIAFFEIHLLNLICK